MQHQSQDLRKGATAGRTGPLIEPLVISGEAIERHIAAAKQMQAEAVAAMLRGAFRRLAAAFRRRPAGPRDTVAPHRA